MKGVGPELAAAIPGGGAMPVGWAWSGGCGEAEFDCEAASVEGESERYSCSNSSSVSALEPGGREGEPLAYMVVKIHDFSKTLYTVPN